MCKKEEIFPEIQTALYETLQKFIEQKERETGIPRELISVEIGKALVVTGCSFITAPAHIGGENMWNLSLQCIDLIRKTTLSHMDHKR